jgi:hypothetical protein
MLPDTVWPMRWSGKRGHRSRLAGLELARGERVLAVARTADGAAVAATDVALHFPLPAGDDARVPWERIDHAGWREGLLHVRETGGTTHRLRLAEPDAVPEAVQERVTATVVVSTHVRFPNAGGVRIVGRRAPRSETVNWTFVFDSGLDPADPGLRAKAEQALEDLRRQTGL